MHRICNVLRIIRCYKLIVSLTLAIFSLHSYAIPINSPEWPEEIRQLVSQIDFQSLRKDDVQLNVFFSDFPKGANLHHHYSGGVFPDDMILKAINNALCINLTTYELVECSENSTSVVNATTTSGGQNDIIKAWSVINDELPLVDRISKFFGLFKQLGLLFGSIDPGFLATTKQNAARNQVSHLETMTFTADFSDLKKLIPKDQILNPDDPYSLKQFHDYVTSQTAYKTLLANTLKNIVLIVNNADNLLQCNTSTPEPACDVSLSLLAISDRLHPIDLLFVELIFSFDLAQHSMSSGDNIIRGVNLVGLESQLSSSEAYSDQMELMVYLKNHPDYPLVSPNISLHAGELSEVVGPYGLLTTGLGQTIQQVLPARIGHGVSISEQRDSSPVSHRYINIATELANIMAQHDIAVEVPLTSNRILLDIYGDRHPLPFYLRNHVPVVLATDDPGLLMTTMTKEFVIATNSFSELTLEDFIEIARNSLEFSFKEGESLWQASSSSSRYTLPVSDCWVLISSSCTAYVEKNPKAKLQQRLEISLIEFLVLYQTKNQQNLVSNGPK